MKFWSHIALIIFSGLMVYLVWDMLNAVPTFP